MSNISREGGRDSDLNWLMGKSTSSIKSSVSVAHLRHISFIDQVIYILCKKTEEAPLTHYI